VHKPVIFGKGNKEFDEFDGIYKIFAFHNTSVAIARSGVVFFWGGREYEGQKSRKSEDCNWKPHIKKTVFGCNMSDKRSGLFENQGKEMSSTITADGLKDEVTLTLNKCKIIMTENAERIRKKIENDNVEVNISPLPSDPDKGGRGRQAHNPQQMQLQEFECHSKNITYVMIERQNNIAKKRFLERGDEILSTFEYFSNVVSQVSDYTLDNYWKFATENQKGDTSNFKDGSILSHILRMCNERIM
jgi:hypothetical protein